MKWTPEEEREKKLIQTKWLTPHRSRISADMVLTMRKDYGIPPLVTLTILGAETSLADPELGGLLVKFNNFGCIKYTNFTSKWAELAEASVRLKGKPDVEWLAFKDAWTGMAAWGRLIKVGPGGKPGTYKKLLIEADPVDWRAFAEVYYGKKVDGLESYIKNLEKLAAAFKAGAAREGIVW